MRLSRRKKLVKSVYAEWIGGVGVACCGSGGSEVG